MSITNENKLQPLCIKLKSITNENILKPLCIKLKSITMDTPYSAQMK
jgi:hypothetical protein